MAFAVPYDEASDVSDAPSDAEQPPSDSSDQEFLSIPILPDIPEPVPIARPPLSEPQRQEAITRSRAQLDEATKEVERLKPTLGKLADVVGGGLKTGVMGGTRQAFGNLMRSYFDIVAPETPHAPGSFKNVLQWALGPATALAAQQSDLNDPNSLWNQLRETGRLTAEQGSKELKAEAARAEQVGGGPLVAGAASLASTAGASLPPLAAGPWGLGAMAAASGLQAYGQNIDQFKDRLMELHPDLSEKEAFDKAMVPAALTGAVTAVLTRGFGGTERFIEQLAERGLAEGGIKGALREVFKSAALELPEEYLDQLSQGFTEKVYVDPNKPIKDIFDEAGIAGLSGFALGGITTGTITGVAHGGKALTSRLRRGTEATNAKNQNAPPGGLPAVGGQPINTGPEGEAQIGIAQRGGEGGGGQAGEITVAPLNTTDIVQQAVRRTQTPLPEPKIATFSGYQFDNPNLPQYEIPGVRPGIVRHVSAQTAQQYGFAVPSEIPTFEQWKRGITPPEAGAAPVVSYSAVEAAIPAPMAERFPGQSVQQIAEAYATMPDETIKSYPGGPSKFMHDLGAAARTPEDVAALRRMAEEHSTVIRRGMDEAKRMMMEGSPEADRLLQSAMTRAGLQPAEAYEYATGTTLRGDPKWTTFEDMEKRRGRTYAPPVPDQSYIASHPEVAKSAVTTQTTLTPQQLASSPLDFREFTSVDKAGYRVIDNEKLRALIKEGKIRGGTASEALLAHMLQRSDLHPIEPIKVIDNLTPDQLTELGRSGFSLGSTAEKAAASGAYKGLFTTKPGSNLGAIEIVTRENDGRPITQAEFVRLMVHELGHNNITSKLRNASAQVQQAAHDLYQFVLQRAQGTVWESHNATRNVDEFFSEMLSTPGFQKWLTGLDYSGKATAKAPSLLQSVYGKALQIIRSILKLPEFITTSTGKKVDVITALDEALNLSSQLENVERQAAGLPQTNLSPTTPPPLPGTMAPNLPEAQVQAGAAEVGRIADEVYKHREQGIAALDTMGYQRKQYQTATQEIRRLTEQGMAGFTKMGVDPESIKFPDPTEGVSIQDGEITADNTFSGKLAAAGVPHNPDNVRSMQEQIVYEQSANRFNSLGDRIDTLKKGVENYTLLGAPAEEITKINQELAKLEEKRSALGNISLDGDLVSARANEMSVAEGLRQERMAQRDALSLEPVSDFFGKQVGAFRQFTEKAQAGIALANQLRQAVTDPVALKAATDEAAKWMTIPEDVRNAVAGGKQLTVEQKASVFSALSQVFEDFDYAYTRMKEQVEARVPEINKQIHSTLEKITKAKVESGMGQVLVADVTAALDGETGLTGNLKSLQENQALRERLSAIQKFAETLGDNLQDKNKQGSQALFDWIIDPANPPPQVAENLGVDPQTLELILRAIKRNPDFNSAILSLIEATNSKIANLPATGIQQIEELVKQNTPEAQAQAEAIAQDMLKKGKSQTSLANTSLRGALKELDALEIQRKSLQEGRAMFDELVASPEFGATREAVSNSPYGLVEPMVPQNNRETTFKAFGGGNLPSHPDLVIGSNQNPQFKSQWYQRIAEWRKKAAEHLDAYDKAAADYNQTKDSENPSPSPQQLGFDIPKVRGLRDALQRMIDGAFLETSLNSENKRWAIPWLGRKLSKLDLFRQHDFVAKLVGGMTGTDLRARLTDFVNHFLTAQSIRDKYKDLPDRLHQALKSHPELQMNIQNYREHFNELAHWGRMFGSPVREGFILPRSQRKVTKEDVALLTMERAYEEELRRRVTETNPTQGVRINTPTRTLVRPGAYVGDQGVPRFLNRHADSFISNILAAYGEPAAGFTTTSDLSATSPVPAVQFWNQNTPMLVQHILDARRQDRSMTIAPHMQAAENDLMADWLTPGHGVPKLSSVEELVQALTAKFPSSNVTGLNPRDEVIKGLNAELRQYRDAAKGIENDRLEREQARQSKARIAFSADNEFTRPAAKLQLPSELYDYGALSPGDHMAMSSRANHERIVGYATAVERAIAELQARYDAYQRGDLTEKQAAQSYGGNINEMTEVLGILRSVAKDFEAAYNSGSFTQARKGFLNDTTGLLTSAILALPTVGLRNMTQGQMEVYAMSRAMGNAGHIMTAARALKAVPQTLIRFGVHALDGIINNTQLGKALGPANHKLLVDMVGQIGNALTGDDFRAVAAKVGELGMDNRESFLKRLGRIMQETEEFVSREDQEKAWTVGGRKVGATAAIPAKVLRALFDKIGVQQYDFAINTQALNNAELISQRLKQVAYNYGKAREQAGLTTFDPTNRAFDLKPSEWATGEHAQDSLAFMRHVLESSVSPEGFQLERSMWDWYQAQKQNPQAPMFNERQKDALQKRLLADFNASTPANRPSAAAGSNVIRNLLLLQGYPSDLMLKLLNTAFGGARDRAGAAKAIAITSHLTGMALMAVLIGYITSAVTGSWEKWVRGRQPSLATPLDADFWSNWKRWGSGTLALGAAQLGYIGDIILALKGEIVQNRGFDPSGRVLSLSLFTRALNALRGAYNTAKGAGNVQDALVPLADVGRSLVPFWLETERVLGQAMRSRKQAERVIRGEADVQGLIEGRSGFQAPTYGPTTVVRRNLGDAIDDYYQAKKAGDEATAAAKLQEAGAERQKLFDYHYSKYIAAGKDPATARQMAERDTWNDYQELNPAVSAMMGKRPTQDQFNLLMQGITGDRKQIVDEGLASWQSGAQALFGRQGTTTREEVAAGRGGGFGGGFNIPGLVGPKMPTYPSANPFAAPRERQPSAGGSAGASAVSSPVRRVQSQVRRIAQAPLAAVRMGVRAARQSGLLRGRAQRAPAVRRPRMLRAPAVSRSLVRRHRRAYA